MVEPKGYSDNIQKMEYLTHKILTRYLAEKFIIRYSPIIFNPHTKVEMTPDVAIYSKGDKEADIPEQLQAIFEVSTNPLRRRKDFKNKERQLDDYTKMCPTILVLKGGYNNMSYCVHNDFHIVDFKFLPLLVELVGKALNFSKEFEEYYIDFQTLFKEFSLRLSQQIEKCSVCSSSVDITFIYNCYNYGISFPFGYLDTDDFNRNSHEECSNCAERRLSGGEFNYEHCPRCEIIYCYQCKKCGAIFNPDGELITNLDSHAKENLVEDDRPESDKWI